MARRQDDAGRAAVAFLRCHRFQRMAQQLRILVHRLDPVLAEQLRKHPHHDLAVLQHVADPGRGAAVILQHVEFVLGRADQIDADDMGIDPARGHKAHDGLFIGLVAIDQPRRNAARADDFATAIDVAQKGVQGAGALLDAAFQLAPLGLFEDPRHHVEGDQAVGVAALAIDGEGDADAAEQILGLGLFHLAEVLGHGFDPFTESRIGIAHPIPFKHFVIECHHPPTLDKGTDGST